MFLAFIAIALELAAMAFGAKLVVCCCKANWKKRFLCEKGALDEYAYRDKKEQLHESYIETGFKEGEHGKKTCHRNCFAFFEFIGYFTIIISFIALVCTIVAFGYFLNDVNNLKQERELNGPTEQYHYDLDKLRIYSANDGDHR